VIANYEIVLRLLLGALLGSVIGMERERRKWTAGLRTHMLVAVGSTLFMIVSAFGFVDILGYPNVELDPSRIAAQVVSGIGFLGAGTIILRSEVVRGLTTASSLWSVAAIGLAVGGGLYVAAASATIVILVILAGLKPLEKYLFSSRPPGQLLIVADRRSPSLADIESALAKTQIKLKRTLITPGKREDEIRMRLTLESGQKEQLLKAIEQVRALPGIRELRHKNS